MKITAFFDWTYLATFAGAVAATAVLTQFTKDLITQIPTRFLSYIYALVVLLAANFFTGTLDVSSGVLCILNAVLVSLSANGGYDFVTKKKKK